MVSSAYLRLLIFLPTILIPVCALSSPAFCMMYSAYKLNKQLSHFVMLWTIAHQAPLCMEFSRQKCWSRLPYLPPGALPNPGIKPYLLGLLHWQECSLPLALPGKPKKIHKSILKDTYYENLLTWLWRLRYATIYHLQAGDSEQSVV